MQNYKITLSYDGTDFHGWQRQPEKRTVQGVLEDTLSKITQRKIPIAGAGRTDAGVHAQEQVANFKVSLRMERDELFRAIRERQLPGEVPLLLLTLKYISEGVIEIVEDDGGTSVHVNGKSCPKGMDLGREVESSLSERDL